MMKKLAILVSILAVAGAAHAAPNTTITNYYAGYVLVASSSAATNTLADVGLAGSTAYACIPVSVLTYCTEAEAAASGGSTDVRALVFSINKALYDAHSVLVATNQFTVLSINESIKSGSSGDVSVTHNISADIDLGTTTLPSE